MKPKIEIKCSVQGTATWRITDSDGNIRRSSECEAQNLVVNNGLDALYNTDATALSGYCRVGTGNSAPSPTQTALDAQLPNFSGFGANDVSSNSGAIPWWVERKRDYTFPAGTIDGVALAELGFFTNGGDMFSRLLFLDGGMNPTTITLLPDEILTVTYALRLYAPPSDVTGTFDVDDGLGGITTHSYTLRPAQVDIATYWDVDKHFDPITMRFYETDVLGDQLGEPSGTWNTAVDTAASYISGSFERKYSFSAGLTVANFPTGIGSGFFYGDTAWQFSFSPKLQKDNTQTLTFTDFFILSWAAGTP